MSGKVTTGSVLMMHDAGLHARPSVKLTKLAKTFGAKVELSRRQAQEFREKMSL